MNRINTAVGEQGGIELGGLFGVTIEPEARGYARHGDFPPKSGGVGRIRSEHCGGRKGHAGTARLKAHIQIWHGTNAAALPSQRPEICTRLNSAGGRKFLPPT